MGANRKSPDPFPLNVEHELAAGIVQQRFRRLVHHTRLPLADEEDLHQELRLYLLTRLAKFQPDRGSAAAFLHTLIQRSAATIARFYRRAKRDRRRQCSLNSRVPQLNGEGQEQVTLLSSTDGDRRRAMERRDVVDALELRLSVQDFIDGLQPEDQRLCELLREMSISDAARILGIPRTTLQSRVTRLRDLCEDAGLRDFL